MPYVPEAKAEPSVRCLTESVLVSFDRVRLLSAAGTPHPALHLSLEYEIFSEGVCFCSMFLRGESLTPATLEHFSLSCRFEPEADQNVEWAYWHLPEKFDAALIQNLSLFGRKIPITESRTFDATLLPFVGFDFGADWRRDRHIEFFLENTTGLEGVPSGLSTVVSAENGKPGVEWNFLNRHWSPPKGRSIMNRNTWGFCLCRAARSVRRTPLRIYHYFDNFTRYPSQSLIRDIREAGANTLILHENWRLDERNSELPFDRRELEAVVKTCRDEGLRLGLYFRANEEGIRERGGEFVTPWLRRDLDGLYLDYGSPVCYVDSGECAPLGRVHFREYHRVLRVLRRLIGEEGFLISHSGSFFCAMAHVGLDGYLGGEQEQGRLLESRSHHAYFASLAVAPAYWWTASFPSYRTPQAVALMAATLHAPVAMLGCQIPASPLNQPPAPEVSKFPHWLWRLWALLDGCGPLSVFDTHRSPEVFLSDCEAVAPTLMVTPSGEGLLTVTNLSQSPVQPQFSLGLPGDVGFGMRYAIPLKLRDGEPQALGAMALDATLAFAADLEPWEVAGWLLCHNPADWGNPLEKFAQVPVWTCAKAQKWRQLTEIQHRWRTQAPDWSRCFLRFHIPNWPNAYEDSLWQDLFSFDVCLEMVTRDGDRWKIGSVSRDGLVAQAPEPESRLAPGEHSPWIELPTPPTGLLTSGHAQELVISSRRADHSFYCMFALAQSPVPGEHPEMRKIEFSVDEDTDWSSIKVPWPCRLEGEG